MKSLFTLICLVFCLMLNAQVSTTEEEYNYLTKGYPEQLQKGGDMKLGYELIPITEKGFEDKFFVKISKLKEMSTNNIKAISVVVSKNNEKFRYLCIPINNKELFKKFRDDYFGLGLSMGTAFEAAIIKSYSELVLLTN